MRMRKVKKQGRKGRKVRRRVFGMAEICAAVSLAGLIGCCEAAAGTNRAYCEGRETYEEVRRAAGMEMVVEAEDEWRWEPGDGIGPELLPDAFSELLFPAQPKKTSPALPSRPPHRQPSPPTIDASHGNLPQIPEQHLRQLNSEYYFWLYIPETNINYPVVWHEDNRYYLDHKFDGEAGACGCLFADCRSEPFAGPVTIVYGHNMRDGSMFAGLKNYADEAYLEHHRTIYVFYGGTWTECTVRSCEIADDEETVWPAERAGGEYAGGEENAAGSRSTGYVAFGCPTDYAAAARPIGDITGSGNPASQKQLLLYTCQGSKKRLIVQAVIEGGG